MSPGQDSPRRAQAARVRLGSTSMTTSATSVKKTAMTVQRAGLYPFLAASQAVSATDPTHSTRRISSSGSPMFTGRSSSPAGTGSRGQASPCRSSL